MVERIEDLNLPNSVVSRLMKEALPDNVSISKEARAALTRAASVFVLYLTTQSTTAAKKAKHKTMMPNDVFDALNEIEFENFVDPLKEALEIYRSSQKSKKDKKKSDVGSGGGGDKAKTDDKKDDESDDESDVIEVNDSDE